MRLRVLLLGAPGVGKGTYGVRLAKAWNVPHIATGDLIRNVLLSATDHPDYALVHSASTQGLLVPSSIVDKLLHERLSKPDVSTMASYLLDGYPRTLEQAEKLAVGRFPPMMCVNLEMPDELLITKLMGRRSCSKCNWSYNVADIHQDDYCLPPLLPTRPGICDNCGVTPLELTQREDDCDTVIRERLQIYHSTTKPLVEYYALQGKLLQFRVRRGIGDLPELKQHIATVLNDVSDVRLETGNRMA